MCWTTAYLVSMMRSWCILVKSLTLDGKLLLDVLEVVCVLGSDGTVGRLDRHLDFVGSLGRLDCVLRVSRSKGLYL